MSITEHGVLGDWAPGQPLRGELLLQVRLTLHDFELNTILGFESLLVLTLLRYL